MVAMIVLCGANNVKAGGKTVTLVEGMFIPPGTTVELDSVSVGAFQQVSILGSNGGPSLKLDCAFTAEPGKFSDPVPKVEGSECLIIFRRGVAQCSLPSSGTRTDGIFRVGGPFLAVRMTTFSSEVSPSVVTLKIFLSK